MNGWWKYGVAFLGGAMAGAWVCRNSRELREVCVAALGGAMNLRDKAVETAGVVKESAEDMLAEADARRKAAAGNDA